MHFSRKISLLLLLGVSLSATAQFRSRNLRWSADGNATVQAAKGGITRTDVRSGQETTLVTAAQLTPTGGKGPITVADFASRKS